MQLKQAVLVLCASVALWLVAERAAHAQAAAEFIPSVSLFTVYDDNLFAQVDGSAGQMLQLRPMFEGSYESPIVRLLGLYSFDMQRSNFATLNTFDARRHALGETRFRTTPFTTLGLAARYDRSETPGDIELETGVLGERRTAERLEVTPSYIRRLGPRSAFSGSYTFTTENLIDGERGTLHVGRMGLSRDTSERTNIGLNYVGRYFLDQVDRISNHQSHALLLAWTRVLAPGTRMTLGAGPKATSYRGLDAEVNATFARTTPRVRLALDYWHGDTIVLGVTGPVAVDSVSSRISWPFTRRFEFGTHFGVSDLGAIDNRNSTIYRGSLVGSWTTGGMYTFAVTYDADYQRGSIRNPIFIDDERVLFDDRVLRHVVRLSLTVAPRYKRSILPPDEAARAKGVTR